MSLAETGKNANLPNRWMAVPDENSEVLGDH
jgi:hypothetical protein